MRIEAPSQSRKIAMTGMLDLAARELVVEISRTKTSANVIALLERLDRIYGPKPGAAGKPAVIVVDIGPVHNNNAALAAREPWLRPVWLPVYAP